MVMNEHLTGPLGKLRGVLPMRRHKQGSMPGITNADLNSKNGNIDKQWIFPDRAPIEDEIRDIISRCTEIAVRTIFRNFCYAFGGKLYRQKSGGPIGLRITMACSRMVMQDWGEQYQSILLKADLKITLLKSYVDDIRKACSLLKMGTRFEPEMKIFTWNREWEEEDRLLKEQGETKDARMARVCQPAMDSIIPDLKFTTEIEEDFQDKKLPTLDFKAWLLANGHILHTYFEKTMKNKVLLMKRSAMATKQKFTILSNELTRRLSNCDREGTDQAEKDRICEEFIRQLRNSGFGRCEVREMVLSGIKGWLRRHQRREQEGVGFYRSAGH